MISDAADEPFMPARALADQRMPGMGFGSA